LPSENFGAAAGAKIFSQTFWIQPDKKTCPPTAARENFYPLIENKKAVSSLR
jgi:hypothetical protein